MTLKNKDKLFEVAQEMIKNLYSSKANARKVSYKDFRYNYYNSLKNKDLCSLPPTVGALCEHALRVYFQCQYWLENELKVVRYQPCIATLKIL